MDLHEVKTDEKKNLKWLHLPFLYINNCKCEPNIEIILC